METHEELDEIKSVGRTCGGKFGKLKSQRRTSKKVISSFVVEPIKNASVLVKDRRT